MELFNDYITPLWAFLLISDNESFQHLSSQVIQSVRKQKALIKRGYGKKHIQSLSHFVAFGKDIEGQTEGVALVDEKEFQEIVEFKKQAQIHADALSDDGHAEHKIKGALLYVENFVMPPGME